MRTTEELMKWTNDLISEEMRKKVRRDIRNFQYDLWRKHRDSWCGEFCVYCAAAKNGVSDEDIISRWA